jgi:predicted PurR-regulated permease PerM
MDINKLENKTILRILVVISAFLALLWLGYLVKTPLFWIITAAFLAIALNPAVAWMSRWMPRKSRGLAAISVFLIGFAILGFVGANLVPPLISQSQGFIRSLPDYINRLQTSNSFIGQNIRHYDVINKVRVNSDQVISKLFTGASNNAFRYVTGIFGSIAAALTISVLTVFMLIEGPGWIEKAWRLNPHTDTKRQRRLAGEMYESVTGYVIGNLLTSLIAGVCTFIFLAFLHVPYALALSLLVALLDLLPLIGATLAAIIVVAVSLSVSVPVAIAVLIFFIVYQQLENHILQPYVYGKTIQMSPLLVLVSALIGAAAGGLIGALVAVPIGASLAILFREYVGDGEEATPKKA